MRQSGRPGGVPLFVYFYWFSVVFIVFLLHNACMNRSMREGLVATILAHVIWGILPMYWKPLLVMQPWHLISWRMIIFMPCVWLVHIAFKGRSGIRFPGWNNCLKMFGCSLLIITSWFTMLLGVSLDMTVEVSLGYYITPLSNVLLGVLFLGERLVRLQWVALALASAALVLMSIEAGQFPAISVVLGLAFSLYGFASKKIPKEIDSIESLAWQSLMMTLVSLVILAFTGGYHSLIQENGVIQILLLGSGAATLLPLWLFVMGVRRLPMGIAGFLQYIGPSLVLAVAVLVFGESFGLLRVIAFCLVFVALILYSMSMHKSS